MTRERVVYELENSIKLGISISREAREWLLDYLEQEPTTKNDLGVDAVSRKDVHDMLENLPITVEDKWFNWLQKACMRLAELPSVTPQEPKTGHWDIKDNMWWVCSACGCQTRMMKKYNVPNFCPACGAKMVEPQEGEDKE